MRVTVGTARRLWQAGDPGQRYVVAVRSTGAEASRLPTISVVVSAPAGSAADGPPEMLRGQTADGLELASWDPGTGLLRVWSADETEVEERTARTREELLDAVSGEWLMMVTSPVPRLPATLFEELQWLVATEPIRYVRIPVQPRDMRHSNGDTSELVLSAREVFDPVRLIDPDRLARVAPSHPVVGKTVRLAGPLDAASPRPVAFAGDGRGAVVAVGRYELWARRRWGPVDHPVAAVSAGATARWEADPRPGVLVVVAEPLDGGFDRLVGGLVRALAGEIRFHVVTTRADNTLGLTRSDLFDSTGVAVHELGSILDPSVWPSALIRIAGRCAARTVLLVGWDERLGPAVAQLRSRGLRVVAFGVDDIGVDVPADQWVAASAADAETLARTGIPSDRIAVAPIGLAEIGARKPGSYGREPAIRAQLGVPDGHRLVLTLGDLVPRCRPEDAVLVADRLRGEDGLFFLLVGEGPLAGRVADLAAYLDLPNVRVRPQGHSTAELVAAADVILDPAAFAPSRPAVLAALAAGTPVVATRGSGITELVGPSAVEFAGDPEALAGALRRVLSGEVRAPDPAGVRMTIESGAGEGIGMLRRALLAGGPDGPPA